MNWVAVALPLTVSVALLTAVAVLYISADRAFRNIEVPLTVQEEPDVEAIKTAFGRVFREPAPAGDAVAVEEANVSPDISLLGVALGSRNMALLKVGDEIVVLEEGERKKGILLRKVMKEEAVVVAGGSPLRLKLERGKAFPVRQRTYSSDVKISRREIERLTRDPGIMFREIRLVPYVKNGRTEGFVFEWIKPGSLFYRAGLRKGDILLSINNMTIKRTCA